MLCKILVLPLRNKHFFIISQDFPVALESREEGWRLGRGAAGREEGECVM
jgi:hypothetical protein